MDRGKQKRKASQTCCFLQLSRTKERLNDNECFTSGSVLLCYLCILIVIIPGSIAGAVPSKGGHRCMRGVLDVLDALCCATFVISLFFNCCCFCLFVCLSICLYLISSKLSPKYILFVSPERVIVLAIVFFVRRRSRRKEHVFNQLRLLYDPCPQNDQSQLETCWPRPEPGTNTHHHCRGTSIKV